MVFYNRGAGGDNPNVVASILRGIDPRETLDITPLCGGY